MSIKGRAVRAFDELQLGGWKAGFFGRGHDVALTPVFHVEQLFVDRYYEGLRKFVQEYVSLTGKRAVLTCMTPFSPVLAMQLREYSFSADKYWGRLAALGEYGLIGLHGHFVRGVPLSDFIVPMHFAFHDLEKIRVQMIRELGGLKDRDLVDEECLIYAAGWWFTSSALRKILVDLGFKWDYSVSSSEFNISPGLESFRLEPVEGIMAQNLNGSILRSPTAIASIAKANRPYHSISRIRRALDAYASGEVTLCLYSHDYDLHAEAALQMVRRYQKLGFRFVEPA